MLIQKKLRSHHLIEIEKLRKYPSGILYIENNKAYVGEKSISA